MEHSLHSALDSAQLLELSQAGQHTFTGWGKRNKTEGHSPDTPRAQKRRHSQTNTHASYLSFAETRPPVAQDRQTEPNTSARALALPTCTALQLPHHRFKPIPGFNWAVGQRAGHRFVSCLVTTCISGHLLTDPLTDGKLGGHWEGSEEGQAPMAMGSAEEAAAPKFYKHTAVFPGFLFLGVWPP